MPKRLSWRLDGSSLMYYIVVLSILCTKKCTGKYKLCIDSIKE